MKDTLEEYQRHSHYAKVNEEKIIERCGDVIKILCLMSDFVCVKDIRYSDDIYIHVRVIDCDRTTKIMALETAWLSMTDEELRKLKDETAASQKEKKRAEKIRRLESDITNLENLLAQNKAELKRIKEQ